MPPSQRLLDDVENEYAPLDCMPFLGDAVVQHDMHLDIQAFLLDLSYYSNLILLVLLSYAWVQSWSDAVLACSAELLVDLACQSILIIAERKIHRMDPKFPVGKTRLDAVAVILSTCVMAAAATEVVHHAAVHLFNGFWKGLLHQPNLTFVVAALILFTMAYKAFLCAVCWLYHGTSDGVDALATEHFNSAAGTLLVLIAVWVSHGWSDYWFLDALGALTLVLFIVGTWARKVKRQISKVAGRAAPEAFIAMLEQMALSHSPGLQVDVVRAYHFGSRYMVEMEVVLPAEMTVGESQEIALLLQHKVEALYEVERAFVIVDYKKREEPKHKVERNLLRGARDVFASEHQSLLRGAPSSPLPVASTSRV